MFALKVQIKNMMPKVAAAEKKATFANFRHASARISKDAKASIKRSEKVPGSKTLRVPAAPSKPPKTRLVPGHNLRGAIRWDADQQGGIIGPLHSIVGTVGEAHEFGVEYRGQDYAERPFMQPAMDKNLDRFAQNWAGSIGE